MRTILKNIEAQAFLDDFEKNSETIILEEGAKTSELAKIAQAKGMDIKSRDLGFFKTVYAFTDKPNDNGAILPEKELVKVLPQIIGKPINLNHNRDKALGHYIDYKYIAKEKKIIAYGVFYKTYFGDLWDEAKDLFKSKKLSTSFEIWSPEETRKKYADGTYELTEMEMAGGALVYEDKENQPAFRDAKVLQIAQLLANKAFDSKDLVFATTKKYKDNEIITCKNGICPIEQAKQEELEKAETYSCECLDCKHQFTSSTHCNSSKCPKCGSSKVRRADKPGTGRPDQSPNADGILDIKCANCGEEFKAKTDIRYKCPKCFAIVDKEGTMIYPPQIKDFSISCPSCHTNNWLILSTKENNANLKCNQCSKEYKVNFSTIEPSEIIKKLSFLYTTSIRCPQCGNNILFSGVSSITGGNVKCKKCELEFPFDIQKAKKYKNISSIEEIIDKKDDKENKGGKEMELNKDKKDEKVQKPEEKIEAKSETSEKASTQEAPKSEEKTEITSKENATIEVVEGEPKVIEKTEDETPKEETKVEETEEKKEESKVEESEEKTETIENKEEKVESKEEKYPKTKILRKAITEMKELKNKVKDNDGLVEDIKKLKSAIRKLAKRVIDAKKETKLFRENALKIVERRAELDDYKKDEITDEQILNDDIFEKAKLEKANLDSKTTQSDEQPIVGTKTKGDDFYANKRKKVDEYIENRLKKNKEELEKAKINVD